MAQWIFTRDHISDGRAEGTCSRSYQGDKSAVPHPFRMKDDDRELYYSGLSSCDSSFAPLDDFGGPDSGCTIIEYKNPKTQAWEIL